MNDLKTGDNVRWECDVEKVYSQFTKKFVGRVGVIVDTKVSRPGLSRPKTNSPGCFDIQFPCGECDSGSFTVWDIEQENLVKVNE